MAINLNKVQLIGRLGADPEQRGGDRGPVALRLATSEKWKDKSTGEKREKVEWHSVTVWPDATKGFLLEYAHKGDLVYVEGQLETSEYEKDGERRFSTSVVVKPFSGGVQLMNKEGSSDSQGDRSERSSGRTSYEGNSSGRPGARRGGAETAFDPRGMDDDIPF